MFGKEEGSVKKRGIGMSMSISKLLIASVFAGTTCCVYAALTSDSQGGTDKNNAHSEVMVKKEGAPKQNAQTNKVETHSVDISNVTVGQTENSTEETFLARLKRLKFNASAKEGWRVISMS